MMDSKVVKVSDVMRTSLHVISGLASVQDAIAEMSQHKVSSLIIDRRDRDDENHFEIWKNSIMYPYVLILMLFP